MHQTAAHLVDRVIPFLPMRQWVVTFAPRVRWHLAADPKLASQVLTLVLRVLFSYQRKRARSLGVALGRANSNGAITFIQRFSSALELNLHFHILMPDGVFSRPPGAPPETRPRFVAITPPTEKEIEILLQSLRERVTRWLEKRGRLDPDLSDTAVHTLSAAAGSRVKTSVSVEEPALPRLCARSEGFSLHAGSAIGGKDRVGLERLCRYGARPALSMNRLRECADGRIEYRMKRTFSDGTHTLVFTAEEFLTRLCALVAPPRFNLTRYHGLFAARARGRAAMTGQKSKPRPAVSQDAAPASPARNCASPPNPERPGKLPWADLLQRVFEEDVRKCARCGGRMKVVAYLTDLDVLRKVLEHLHLPSEPPARGPPRRATSPSFLDG